MSAAQAGVLVIGVVRLEVELQKRWLVVASLRGLLEGRYQFILLCGECKEEIKGENDRAMSL